VSYTLDFPIQYIANPDRFATIGLGKLYIGVVDGAPAFDPADRIQVYIARQNDTDLAIPQPINLTAGGVPTYLGSPVTIKINQSFSCAVLDRNNQQVYYSPKSGEIIDEISNLENLINEFSDDALFVIENVAALATFTPVAGQVYYLKEYHAGAGAGGGELIAKPGSPTPDNGTIFSTGVSGVYLERVFDGAPDINFYGAGDIEDLIQKCIDNYNCAYVPTGTYTQGNGSVALDNESIVIFDGAIIETNGVNFNPLFTVGDKTGWGILGSCTYKGSLSTSGDVGDEKFIYVEGGARYRVENVTAQNTRSTAFDVVAGVLGTAPRGDQGQWSDCAAYECRTGLSVAAASTAEFNVFNNFNAAGCLDGAIIGGGNTTLIGGNIVDNLRGITIIGGSNHAHGICSGVNINHNASWNIKTVSVTNGHTFDACHAYGNGGTTAPVWFENSKNVTFQNGKLDCAVYNDGATGTNAIINNNLPGTDAQILGTNPEMLRILGNWTPLGSWASNDPAAEYSMLNRATSSQAVTAGTTLIFNNAIKDKRSLYNTTTGVYTAKVAGIYRIMLSGSFSGTTLAGYVAVEHNGSERMLMPVSAISASFFTAIGAIDLLLAAGDTVEFVSQITGTSPELRTGTSYMSISLI